MGRANSNPARDTTFDTLGNHEDVIILLGHKLLPDGSPSTCLQTRAAAAAYLSNARGWPIVATGGSVSEGPQLFCYTWAEHEQKPISARLEEERISHSVTGEAWRDMIEVKDKHGKTVNKEGIGATSQGSFPVTVILKNPPEAVVMENLLLKAGVSLDMIFKESAAFNTIENATLSLPVLKQVGAKRAALITSDFHMPRSTVIFESIFAGLRAGIAVVPHPEPTGREWPYHENDLHFEVGILYPRMVAWLAQYCQGCSNYRSVCTCKQFEGFSHGVKEKVAAAIQSLKLEINNGPDAYSRKLGEWRHLLQKRSHAV